MSLNDPLSQPEKGISESERTAKKHAKNKRQKSKRAASPTSSYLSMRTDWSIDPPTNFKDGETFPLHSRIKRKRETSPVASYISLKSDNPMNVSEGNDYELRVRAASPTPTYLSLKTDWSIDPPTNFKTEETFPLDPRLLTDQHLRCPLCKSMLKDPVSIPCGHNYCSACINAFWDNCVGEYACPHCSKASETRPVLNTNAALAEVVKNLQQAGFSPALPPQSYAGPEDVACDLCSERRLKSVKSCTTCGLSLCETHVRQHYTVPALQKHTLCDVTGDIKTRPSQQLQTSDNSFNSTASGQQHHTDKTQDIIKYPEICDAPKATTLVLDEPVPTAGTEHDPAMIPAAVRKETETETEIVPESEPENKSNQETSVATKLQTRLKRSAKTFRPKKKEKKENVKSLALICSTLQQEVSGLKEKLSNLETKNTKTEKYVDEEDYDYDKEEEEDDDEEDYDYGDEDKEDDDEEEEDEEYELDDYGDDNEDYSEKDFDAESDEEEEDDEDSFDDEDGYKDDYDWEKDDWKENEDEEDYDDDNNSEEDSDEDLYDDNVC
ncbi:uncharacterized protein [Chanodichthys erythropterus]|uniref:uncharacterized protein n=1 Tax=Chanodichthys erythropterus TaxID=933992 RepID=UPI00351DCE60